GAVIMLFDPANLGGRGGTRRLRSEDCRVESLFFLALFVGLITLVGHGLWVLFGHLFRVLLGGEDPRAARARAACCVRCGKQFLSWIRACPNCGLARGAASDEFRELEITERNVCRLVRQGDLDEETADRLLPCLARP